MTQTTIKLLPHQLNALKSKAQIAGICGSRALGKTYYLSVEAVLSLANNERCIIFAQTYKALTMNIFTEIMKRCEECGIPAELHRGNCTITYGKSIIFGFTYDSANNCRGATEIHKLLLDELFYAPNDLLAIAAPCLRGTGKESKIRFASSPRAGSYWNKWIRDNRDVEWWSGKMTDNTFLSESDIKLAEEAVSDPLMKRQELYGEILDDVVENCIVNITDFVSAPQGRNSVYICGIDFARTGDNTVITVRNDYEVVDQVVMKGDSHQIYSEFCRLDNTYHFRDTFEDATGGFNIGFHDLAKLTHKNLHEINFGGKATNPSDANMRTNMYFNLATAIQNGFFIPFQYNSTVEQIKATSYIINNSGKRALVPKDIIKNIIGHSPDEADSLALTFCSLDTVYAVDETRCRELTSILFR